MAYDKKYRNRALEFKANGHSFKELKEVFGIDNKTHDKWKKQLEETGSLCTNYPKTRKRKISKEELERIIKENPTAFLHEIAGELSCSKVAVFYALKRHKITLKKGLLPTKKKTDCDV
jgi:transposase